jgi:hypothetical protein
MTMKSAPSNTVASANGSQLHSVGDARGDGEWVGRGERGGERGEHMIGDSKFHAVSFPNHKNT